MTGPKTPRLSKSRLAAFKQCPKRLWLEHYKVVEIKHGAAAEARFAVGNRAGALARELVGHGLLIEHQDDLGRAIAETDMWSCEDAEQPIFEGTFERDGVLVRVDALLPVRWRQGTAYRLCEVKSSAEVKPYHYFDIAVQKWVIEGQSPRLRIKQSELVVIDKNFVYQGMDDYAGLFKSYQVDHAIGDELAGIPVVVQAARKTLRGKEPKIEMGPHCTAPFACPFIEHCSKGAPPLPKYPVTLLPRGQRLAAELIAEGYTDLRKVPAKRMEGVKSQQQQRVHAVTVSGTPYLAADAARALAKLPYPRFYLDFETVAFAVPVWEGTRPYEALPFQWSCHIETAPGKFTHKECLADDDLYPVWWVMDQLREVLGRKGVIFVYSGYESRILKAVAARHPDLAPSIRAILARLFDLYPLTGKYYYHPDMRGKWSMKNVLPAIAPELDYANLGEVQGGSVASAAFMKMIAETTPTADWRTLRRDLLDYCERDTWAMVRLVRVLEGGEAYQVPGGAKGRKAAHADGRPRRKRGPAPQRDGLADLLAPGVCTAAAAPRARR